ncbi:MAG: exopolysaccharide biosynthesis polyprenyl glycosylphosphotransferase [Lacunisphaera sp.]
MNQATLTKPAIMPAEQPGVARGRRITLELITAAMLGDIITVFLALAASSWLRFASPLSDWGVDGHSMFWTDYLVHMIAGTALFSLIGNHFQIYALPRMLRFRVLTGTLLKVLSVWIIAYIAFAYLLRPGQPLSRLYVALALLTTVPALLAWRLAFHRLALRQAVRGLLRQRVLFVDWSPNASALAEAFVADRQHLYEIVGCVPSSHDDYVQEPPARVRRLGRYDQLAGLLQDHAVEVVVVADLNLSDHEMVRLANLCEKEMVEFKVIPSCFQTLVSGLHLEAMRGVPVLGLSHLPLDNPFNIAAKQAVDIAGSLCGLLLSAPLIALFGFLVYRESPGPIFYQQQRLGRDGRPFWCYKIRSMRLNAEGDGKVGWTKADDPRRLAIGAFMRKWNIDETPQFWNVLKGDMSLVGPRPERPELIRSFKEEIPHYNARHSIKPGITGWAQINGYRGDTDLNARVRCDLYYIENWNLLLDFQIMLLTLFRQKNAC